MPRSFLYLFVLLAAALAAGAATAADIKVMISAGFFNVYADLGPAFEKLTGHKLITTRGPSVGDSPEAIPTRLTRGEGADVVIMDGTGVDLLDQRGMTRPGSRIPLAESFIGMVVRAGQPKPDISTVEAMRKTLLAAKSIAYSDSSSGTYLSTIGFKKLGVADEIVARRARCVTATRFSSCATSFPVLRGGGRRHHESWTEAVGGTVNGRFYTASPSERGVRVFLTSDLSPLVFNAMGELNPHNLPRSGAKPDEDFMAEYLLVSFKTCPWVQRSAISLREKNTPFEFRHIERDNRPDWFLAISPHRKVPVLRVDDSVSLFESSAINEYLDETIAPRLHPEDPVQRAINRAWTDYVPTFAEHVTGVAYADDEAAGKSCLDKIPVAFERLERALEKQGAGPLFNGAKYSLVDAAYAPFLQRYFFLDRIRPIGQIAKYPRLKAWADTLMKRPSTHSFPEAEFEQLYRENVKRRKKWLSQFIADVAVAAE